MTSILTNLFDGVASHSSLQEFVCVFEEARRRVYIEQFVRARPELCDQFRPRPAVVVLTALPPIQYNALDPDVVHCIIRKPFDLGTFMALFVATAAEMCESRRRLANVVAFPQPNAG